MIEFEDRDRAGGGAAAKEDLYLYGGRVTAEFKAKALRAYDRYTADRSEVIARVIDNEKYYRGFYRRDTDEITQKMKCETPLLFAAIENACATSAENFPSPNVIEREPAGISAAEILSKLIDSEFDRVNFRKTYKENVRNKHKYGTAIYGVFYNDNGGLNIKSLDILDVYVDAHVEDIQNSDFLFISAAVSNEVLKATYPEFSELFSGDAQIQTLNGSIAMSDRSVVLDCYYKRPNGAVHMMKLCNKTILRATEDMPGYENGLYNHGLYPIVFDTLYPIEHTPYGFGMLDIGKATQIQIDKIDNSITENIIVTSKPRYFSKKNGGIEEDEFRDFSKNIVHYDGDAESIKQIITTAVTTNPMTYREYKKDELKELIANRDFQQGGNAGGVVSGTAINLLQQSGEKRARMMMDDSYDAYRKIVTMVIELIRQFYIKPMIVRSTDDCGRRSFMEFSNEQLNKIESKTWFDEYGRAMTGGEVIPLEFDVDVVIQKENPFSRESQNTTLLQMWQTGLFNPELISQALVVLKGMNFEGKDRIVNELEGMLNNSTNPTATQGVASPMSEGEVANGGGMADMGNTVDMTGMGDMGMMSGAIQ